VANIFWSWQELFFSHLDFASSRLRMIPWISREAAKGAKEAMMKLFWCSAAIAYRKVTLKEMPPRSTEWGLGSREAALPCGEEMARKTWKRRPKSMKCSSWKGSWHFCNRD
jgi:hypothetical protein